ncbi:MAG TPA: FG-GAP-like repeat-containing protein, partial [Candidatus Nanoarchaeia archaeon]|nr:FG-GAP-like repeat-containing protein [Candidatus Nanoarchaeia archaeon]
NSNLLRKYLFSYSDLGHITGSFLTSIQEAGADGTTKLPATTFGYNTPSAGWEDDAAWQLPQGANFGKDGWKDNGVRLVDINFDGLTDILRMYNSSDLELWINNGEGWEQKKTIGSFFAGGFVGSDGLDKGVRFFDLDSDLRLDIIKAEAGERVVKINRGGNEGWQWNTSNISFPQEADFIKTTGRIIQYIDCNPGGCPSGYSDIGYICDGDYCNITCSNRQCAGSEPQLIWQDTETDSGYGGWCEAKTDYFYYCGSSGGDCIQPQPVCFVLQHLGGGGGADSSVRSQAYEMSCGGSGYDGCTDEFDGSWEWRYEKIMYCVPNFLSCGGDSSCRNDCWKPGAKSWTYWELDPSPNEDCTDSVTFQANEQCGAGLYVYTVPVEGEEIVKSCERQKVYQLPMDQGVNVFDVNGDGHSDIVKSTALEKKTWTSDGKRWSLSPEWQMPEDFVDENGTDKGVRIADLNGDGLPDILKANGTATKSWLNSGKGWIPNDIWTVPTEAMFLSGGNDTGVRIEDINADGLFDLIKNNGSSSKTWLNNGAGWSLVNEWALPAFASTINSLVRLADIDGDGSLDIIKEDGVLINKATYPFLRVSNNSHGGTTTINYTKISNFDNDGDDGISDFGFAGWVVQSISQDSGMAGRWKAVTLIKYNYTGAYYSSSEREYRGFGKVTEKLADVEIEHYYHQDDGRASLEYKTDTFDLQGNPFKSVVYNWQSKEKQGCYVTTLDDITEYTYDGLSWD